MRSVFDMASGLPISAMDRLMALDLDQKAPEEYRQLAIVLVRHWIAHKHRVIGIGGGQGAGKTTLTRLISKAGELTGERIAVLSIDDFYLPRSERVELAAKVHPLFKTRGPPGTHDMAGLNRTIRALLDGKSSTVPVFDKAVDDRTGLRRIDDIPDRIVIEGWCVGAKAQPKAQLIEPMNELERHFDENRIWRTAVQQALMDGYEQLNRLLDCFVFLQVPDMHAVRRWRLQQENDLPFEHRKSAAWVGEFVQYYERITTWMLDHAPAEAQVLIQLGADHSVESLTLR